VAQHSQRLVEHHEECDVEAEAMAEPRYQPGETVSTHATHGSGDDNPIEGDETLDKALLHQNADPPPTTKNNDAFKQCIKGGYPEDKLFSAILEKPGDYKLFLEQEGLVWMKNLIYEEVLCILRDCELIHEIITQAHKTLGHFGKQKIADYIHRWYWWPGIMKDTRTFCRSCESCQQAKESNQPPKRKLYPLPILTKPWNLIGMDFIGPFPKSKGFNYLWVVLCRMISMVHLIPMHTTMKASELLWVYQKEIVCLHGLPSSIVSN